MKKILAVLLSLLMLLSCAVVFASAEDAATYTITFIIKDAGGNDTYNESQQVAEGETPAVPENPEGYVVNNIEYKFNGWVSSTETDPDKRYYTGTVPAATEDVTYTAEFVAMSTPGAEKITLMGFLRDIFHKINQVLDAAAKTVQTWTAHLGKGSDFIRDLIKSLNEI